MGKLAKGGGGTKKGNAPSASNVNRPAGTADARKNSSFTGVGGTVKTSNG
jgi:hypothetical protein